MAEGIVGVPRVTPASVAQWIERLRPKEGVGSSILSGGTTNHTTAHDTTAHDEARPCRGRASSWVRAWFYRRVEVPDAEELP